MSVRDSAVPLDEWVIEPRHSGVVARARELWAYRYLWWYFASNAVKSMQGRGALGWLWFLLRIAGPVGINALIFGGILGQAEKVGPPYFLFFLCGMTTFLVFERSLMIITRSVEQNRRLITKVYFPRMILPVSAVAPALILVVIVFIVMFATVIYFRFSRGIWYISLHPGTLVALAALALSLTFAIAIGLFTSVLQARFPDLRMGLRYFMPFWFWLTPIAYPLSSFPENWRWLAAINPMTHIVEAFKWGTLGEGPLDVPGLMSSLALISATLVAGMWFFNREEAASVDKL